MAFRVLKLIKCSNTLKNTTIYIIFYKISIELKHHFYKNLQKILPSSSEKVARSLAKNQDKKLKLIYLKEHEKEIKKRANYDLADFLNLSKDIPYHITPEKYKPNDFYYNALTLKKYAVSGSSHTNENIDKHLNGMIVYFKTKIDDILNTI